MAVGHISYVSTNLPTSLSRLMHSWQGRQ